MGLFGPKSKKMTAAKRLEGMVQFPGDKSISHRYAMLAAIATGRDENESYQNSASPGL
jgi:3-phosphoshikimate 1-carboxyvinyltransferase